MPKVLKTVNNLIKLPPNMANGGWDIDEDRVRQFCKKFGIAGDIHFRWTAGQYTIGCHRIREENGRRIHGITINQWNSIEESRETILHELCHAIQKDKVVFSEWNTRQENERRMYGYRNSPIEVEARNFAVDMMAEWGDILY